MSVYAMADLHGRFDLYQEVKKFLKPEDKVYFLGDAGDRGPDGWKTIKAIYEDPQFEYIVGNHEHMLLFAMLQLKTGSRRHYDYPIETLLSNGGEDTLNTWMDEGQDFDWIERLRHLQIEVSYINESGVQIVLTHAGYTPDPNRTREIPLWDLVWDRKHIYDEWPDRFNNLLIVHGHTPVQYFSSEHPRASEAKENSDVVWYGQGHKVDIDCGSVWSGKTCLFDLDTFDEHYFKVS